MGNFHNPCLFFQLFKTRTARTEQAKRTNIQLLLHIAVTDVSQVFVFMFLHIKQV